MHDLSLLRTLGLDLDYRPARALLRGRREFPIDHEITPQVRDYLIAGLLRVRSNAKAWCG
jgi:hypothetical protein